MRAGTKLFYFYNAVIYGPAWGRGGEEGGGISLVIWDRLKAAHRKTSSQHPPCQGRGRRVAQQQHKRQSAMSPVG